MFQLFAFIEAHFRLDHLHCAPKAYNGREGHGDISKSRRSVLNARDLGYPVPYPWDYVAPYPYELDPYEYPYDVDPYGLTNSDPYDSSSIRAVRPHDA
jgi:hypothetical protein